jgi:peroxiredoxin
LKNHYRYVAHSLLFTSIAIILPLLLAACSSSASSEVKITTRDQVAEVSKDQTSQGNWIEQVAPAPEAKQPSLDSPIIAPEQPQLALLSDNPAPAASEVESNPSPTATQAPQPTTAAPQAAQPITQDTLPVTDVKVGFSAPNFTLTTLDGKTVQLSDLRGQNVLVNYWVTWCDPCLEELGFLDKLGQEYQSRGFTILSVNGLAQNPLPDVESVVSQNSLTFPILLDENDSFYNTYLVRFLPTSFFIDENGVIRHIQLGSATEDMFRAKIEQLLSDTL